MNTKPRVSRMSREDRKKQIQQSALKVFIEKGYNGGTTQEIAKTANISEVTLFRYFSSKREIFMQSIEPIILKTLEESITASKKLSPTEQFRYVLTERIKLISENHEVIRLILMESQISEELGIVDCKAKIKELISNMILEMGIEVGNKDLYLRLLMGGILSFLYMPENNDENIEEFTSKITNCIKNCF